VCGQVVCERFGEDKLCVSKFVCEQFMLGQVVCGQVVCERFGEDKLCV